MSTTVNHVQGARKAERRKKGAVQVVSSGGLNLNGGAVEAAPARTELRSPTCAIPGCFHLVAGRAWCNKHYQRWVRWGDPLKTLTVRFELKFRGREP